MNSTSTLPRNVTFGLVIGAVVALKAVAASDDALRAYVERPETVTSWKASETRVVEDYTVVQLDLVSQQWREHTWKHQVMLVRPPSVRNPDIAYLFITGDGDVKKQFELLKTLATRAGAVAAAVNHVPNQPLYDGRKEDALIAYTFEQFRLTGDRTWPLLFPMAKSAVKAMDAVQAQAKALFQQDVKRFVVGGASKRGWTTWLTAAVDPRVAAIEPMVIDMLNMKVQTDWAGKMYGKQSEEIGDYTQLNLIDKLDEPRMVELRGWVDPYSHRNQYKLPKLLLLGTNDPYWVVDALRHYWGDLPTPKLVYQTPNAGHDLAGGQEATRAAAAFFQVIADHQKPPTMTWKFEPGNNKAHIEATLSTPAKVWRLWTAESDNRDFREANWKSAELKTSSPEVAQADVPTPSKGYRAYMLEAELVSTTGDMYKLSTEARVTPDGPPAKKLAAAK